MDPKPMMDPWDDDVYFAYIYYGIQPNVRV